MFALGRKLIAHIVPGVVRPIRILWNEVIGFFFLVLGLIALPKAFQAWRSFDGEPQTIFRLLLTGIFMLTMITFGIGSFRRARKISRS